MLVVSLPPRNELSMSRTFASKFPARSGLSATSATRPSRVFPWSSQSRTFPTIACACSTVVAGSRPMARSGRRSSPFTAARAGSDTVQMYDVFWSRNGIGEG